MIEPTFSPAGPAISAVILALVLSAACSGSKVTTQASSELDRYQVRTIALVPFSTIGTPQIRDVGDMYLSTPMGARRSDISLGIPPSAEPPLRQTVVVPPYAAEKITDLFWDRLRDRNGVTVLSPDHVVKSALSLSEDSSEHTPESLGASVVKQLQTDVALIGQVLVYQERVGSRLGANPPASVGFEVKAVTADGLVLWAGHYFERQQPMTQDFLGFIQHGGGFVTADELARYGVDEIMKTFPFGSAEEE